MLLKAPKGVGAVSWEGQNYPVENGMVDVPDEAVVFLEPGYGFTPAPKDPQAGKPGPLKPKT